MSKEELVNKGEALWRSSYGERVIASLLTSNTNSSLSFSPTSHPLLFPYFPPLFYTFSFLTTLPASLSCESRLSHPVAGGVPVL